MLGHVLNLAPLAVVERLSDAHDGNEAHGESGLGFLCNGFVSFAEKLPPFRVADNDVPASGFNQHLRRDFSGERAFLFPKNILRGNGNLRVSSGFPGGMDGGKGWSDYDVALVDAGNEQRERGEKHLRFRLRLKHFPVADDDSPASGGTLDNGHLLLGLVGQSFYPGEFDASKKFERSTASCRDVRNSSGDAGLVNGSDRVASSHDGGCAGAGGNSDGSGDFERAGSKSGHLEDAHGAVPNDGSGFGDFRGKRGDSFWPDVEAHLVRGRGGDIDGGGRSSGFAFRGDD